MRDCGTTAGAGSVAAMSRVNWARIKVENLAGAGPGVRLIDAHSAIKLLSAERRRAVRKCWQQKVNLTARGLTLDEVKIYQQACSDQYWRNRLWLVADDTGTLCNPNEHDLYPFTDEFGEEIGVHCCSRCGNITIEY